MKNGLPLKDDYRLQQRNDTLLIHQVAKGDAGNYTMVLTNNLSGEERRRSFQLLVNGTSLPPRWTRFSPLSWETERR